VRAEQAKHGLYLETFLGAVYPIGTGDQATGRAVVIVPTPDVQLPDPDPQPIDSLLARLPAHCVVAEAEVPRGSRRGTTQTYAEVMGLWERLHLPFLAAADADPDPVRRMEGYRRTIRVDYACELAHQKLSDCARELLRQSKTAKP